MSIRYGAKTIVTDSLISYLDAGNPNSYGGSGFVWNSLSPVLSGSGYSGNRIYATWMGSPTAPTHQTFSAHDKEGLGYFDLSTTHGRLLFQNLPENPPPMGNGTFELTDMTLVVWMRSTDTSGTFFESTWDDPSTDYFGKFDSTNKYQEAGYGLSANHYVDTILRNNIYDYMDGEWHMHEFKGANLFHNIWRQKLTFAANTITSGAIGIIAIYHKSLSSSESTMNFNALRGRYGI